MKTIAITAADLEGVFAVPPLARARDASRSIDFTENDRIVRHISAGGIKRLIYGGNAFLYHIKPDEFSQLLEWLTSLPDDLMVIPSIGPSYGVAMAQASILRRHRFACAMILPCNDPRDSAGLERGYREIAAVAETQLIVYLKDEQNFGSERGAGLDAVGRLVDDGICAGIKYAVVRSESADDPYLESLLTRVDRQFVISGIGERPAIGHLRDWKLPGFTTGSGCIAPRLSQSLFSACQRRDWVKAENLRSSFIPLEDMRDAWGPARVLHHATDLAGIARTGPLPPFVSELAAEQVEMLAHEVKRLIRMNSD
ncbi:MAG TPA: dihydrodipicolinate synthase family protein [Pyrinomonadaceae bacterium]|nr:dihydrodipicolinate synthase family protein [Pyrinomonadaceae bacterium]